MHAIKCEDLDVEGTILAPFRDYICFFTLTLAKGTMLMWIGFWVVASVVKSARICPHHSILFYVHGHEF